MIRGIFKATVIVKVERRCPVSDTEKREVQNDTGALSVSGTRATSSNRVYIDAVGYVVGAY